MNGRMQILGPNQKQWIAALRSGEYEQLEGALGTANGLNCCLGVGCRIAGLTYNVEHGWCDDGTHTIVAPLELVSWLKLCGKNGLFLKENLKKDDGSCGLWVCLTELNDSGWTFEEIADYCERHPENVFTEPA